MGIIYFLLLIIMGAIFLLNLVVAVIVTTLSTEHETEEVGEQEQASPDDTLRDDSGADTDEEDRKRTPPPGGSESLTPVNSFHMSPRPGTVCDPSPAVAVSSCSRAPSESPLVLHTCPADDSSSHVNSPSRGVIHGLHSGSVLGSSHSILSRRGEGRALTPVQELVPSQHGDASRPGTHSRVPRLPLLFTRDPSPRRARRDYAEPLPKQTTGEQTAEAHQGASGSQPDPAGAGANRPAQPDLPTSALGTPVTHTVASGHVPGSPKTRPRTLLTTLSSHSVIDTLGADARVPTTARLKNLESPRTVAKRLPTLDPSVRARFDRQRLRSPGALPSPLAPLPRVATGDGTPPPSRAPSQPWTRPQEQQPARTQLVPLMQSRAQSRSQPHASATGRPTGSHGSSDQASSSPSQGTGLKQHPTLRGRSKVAPLGSPSGGSTSADGEAQPSEDEQVWNEWRSARMCRAPYGTDNWCVLLAGVVSESQHKA